MTLDIYTKTIFNFLKENQNRTLLTEDIADAVTCSTRTVTRKLKILCQNEYILKTGKKFQVLRELEP